MSSTESAFQRVTDLILRQLEAGVVPWRKPWNPRTDLARPLGRRHPYGAFNQLVLRLAGLACPLWVTVERAEKRGWQPRDGQRPWPILTCLTDRRAPTLFQARPRLKLVEVFNLLQLEGPRWRPPRPPRSGLKVGLEPGAVPIQAAQRLVAGIPHCPHIEEGHTGAFYRPSNDTIGLPYLERFESVEEYYSTLFHELVHATGHESRLDRWQTHPVSHDLAMEHYSFEELVAEIGCQYLCAETGIQAATLANSAAYIGMWARRLGSHQTWIVQAAPLAEKAARWLTGRLVEAPVARRPPRRSGRPRGLRAR